MLEAFSCLQSTVAVGEVRRLCCDLFSCNSFFEELSSDFSYSCLQSVQSYRSTFFHFKIKHHQKLITPPKPLRLI